MVHPSIATLGILIIALTISPTNAGAESPGSANQDFLALANRIDRAIAAKWQERGVQPTHPADDAEFLRRVCLDLNGRIPTVAEVRQFLEDPSPDKRRRVVERLLAHPHYVDHFTTVWRHLLIPRSNDRESEILGRNLEPWLRRQFRDNVPYDRMVRDLLTVKVSTAAAGFRPDNPSPLAFYQVNEAKAENLAAATSRLFLGVKIECAQCHDHPFAKWSRRQFWEYAAFFSGIQPVDPRFGAFGDLKDDPSRHVIKISGSDKEAEAHFLDGQKPRLEGNTSARTALADWMVSPANPYFARNAVNRMWWHFFGVGLVDPVDEPGHEHAASHPELLDELTHEFAAHHFDLKFLMRAIVASKTYQLSSEQTDPSQGEARLFARMPVKGLSAEQLFDSLAAATGYQERLDQGDERQSQSPRREFLARFGDSSDKKTEPQTSILQALSLMNGRFAGEVTDSRQRREPAQTLTLAAVIDAPFFDTAQKQIETLYFAALSRKPRRDELARFVRYVDRGGAAGDRKKALADVFWALLNSSEFILNH
jgi:hypothetical protein